MGKRKILTGVVLGATVGGLLSLLNDDARKYAKDKSSEIYDQLQGYVQDPSNTVKNVREKIEAINELVENNANSAVNALEQVEKSLTKFLPNND